MKMVAICCTNKDRPCCTEFCRLFLLFEVIGVVGVAIWMLAIGINAEQTVNDVSENPCMVLGYIMQSSNICMCINVSSAIRLAGLFAVIFNVILNYGLCKRHNA